MKVINAAHRFTTQEDRIADALIESGERMARAFAAQQAIDEQEADMRQLINSGDSLTAMFTPKGAA